MDYQLTDVFTYLPACSFKTQHQPKGITTSAETYVTPMGPKQDWGPSIQRTFLVVPL